mmetsp:Transcript_19172/g.57311  ORF Transcript_19172/g.57311 Transcript_19172/m.57311 type:complete len:349 (-) Transcript_19172:1194-2240(-)
MHTEFDLAPLHFGEIDLLEQVLRVARAAGDAQAAMLAGAQGAATGGSASEHSVLDAEHVRPAGAQELQLAPPVGRVVQNRGIEDVPQTSVGEVLGGLPIHVVRIVHASIIDELHIAHVVLADEHVVPIELIFHDIRGLKAIVCPIHGKLLASGLVDDITVLVPLDVPGELVVEVQAEALAVVVDVATDLSERRVHGAHLAERVLVPVAAGPAGRPDAILVPRDAVLDEVVGHADEEDPCVQADVLQPIHRAILPPRTDNDILLDLVVHLVAVLRVNSNCAGVPDDVVRYQGVVRAVDGDANLGGIHHGVALEHAERAVGHQVEVQTITPHDVPLAAILHPRVSDVRVA